MKLILKDAKKIESFKQIIFNIKQFNDKILFIFEENKLFIQGIDDNHICVYEVKLTNDWFDEFNVETRIECGINIIILTKILNAQIDGQYITMTLEEDSEKLNIKFTMKEHEYDQYFVMPLFDLDNNHLGIPETEYQVDIQMPTRKIKTVCDKLNIFSDSISYSCMEDGFFAFSDGTEGSMKVQIKMEDISLYAIDEDISNLELHFISSYMTKMCNFYKICDEVNIHFSENIPMKMHYELEHESYISLFLAPKINDE